MDEYVMSEKWSWVKTLQDVTKILQYVIIQEGKHNNKCICTAWWFLLSKSGNNKVITCFQWWSFNGDVTLLISSLSYSSLLSVDPCIRHLKAGLMFSISFLFHVVTSHRINIQFSLSFLLKKYSLTLLLL